VDIKTTSARILVDYDVEGAPATELLYTNGLTVDPGHVTVELEGSADGWELSRVQVTGRRLLKSGEAGNRFHSGFWIYDDDRMPEWVRDLVKQTIEDLK